MRIFAILLFFITLNVSAELSQRECMLLPILDYGDGKIGFKVFEQIEEYLKDNNWCYYRSNSELINILGNYTKNLDSHLGNKDVLRIVAEKTQAGSLIKVTINPQVNAQEVSLEIYGENGEDIYFKEKTVLNTNDLSVAAQAVKNWLDVYEKTIPYDGKIKGVLGDQFTIDIGKKSKVYSENELIIHRPVRKRQHPLLKEVVEWETEKIADAKVLDVNETQAQGKVYQYETDKKLKLGDWVQVKGKNERQVVTEFKFEDDKKSLEFGKMGQVGFFAHLGSGSATLSSTTQKKISGLNYGMDVETELWLTRSVWVGGDLGFHLGSYSKDLGTLSNESNSFSDREFRLKVAYRYLPLGFFYGPQIDGYVGYGNYTYGLETQVNDGFTEVSFSGLLMGAKGTLPLYANVRLYLLFDFLLTSTYEEKVMVYGEDESSTHYRIGIGGNYALNPATSFQGGLQIKSSTANFTGTTKEENFKELSVKLGTVFTF